MQIKNIFLSALFLSFIGVSQTKSEDLFESYQSQKGCTWEDSQYKWVDAIGYDFDDKDKSDAKTCTLRKHDAQFTLNKIEHKIGSLRIVVYNEITDRLDYFYVTKVGRENRLEKGYLTKDRLQERMRSRYNIGRDDYCSFENFRCDSFVELATMSDKKMEKKNPKVKYLLSKSEKYQELFDEQFV